MGQQAKRPELRNEAVPFLASEQAQSGTPGSGGSSLAFRARLPGLPVSALSRVGVCLRPPPQTTSARIIAVDGGHWAGDG
jgi:hypothetical protein